MSGWVKQSEARARVVLSVSKVRFVLLIVSAMIIASVLVYASMRMYYDSGSSLLDLSRPGYQDVRSQSTYGSNHIPTYPSVGALNQNAIDEFKALFDEQTMEIQSVDAFGGDPLDPRALGLLVD
jgi:hypothetical protein